jgi:arylsulfatase
MEAYGFADFNSPGDLVGHQDGGYHFDHLIAGSAITWLRNKGRILSDEGKPWSLTVSLVNPHDVMYFNTDAPGQSVQNTGHQLMNAVRAPNQAFYTKEWDIPVPKSLTQPFVGPGRPAAHGEFLKVWDYVLGHVPLEEERWRRLNNYYLNSIRAVDSGGWRFSRVRRTPIERSYHHHLHVRPYRWVAHTVGSEGRARHRTKSASIYHFISCIRTCAAARIAQR